MRLKSYFATSVEAAIKLASQELGEDAMLVNSRRASPEARELGEYEVVFAAPGVEAAAPARREARGPERAVAEPEGPDPAASSAPPWERISRELTDLRSQLRVMARKLERSAGKLDSSALQNGLDTIRGVLDQHEVRPDLAQQLIDALSEQARSDDEDAANTALLTQLGKNLREEMLRRLPGHGSFGKGEGQPRVVVLIGPPGAGKTTTLVKLASRYGLLGPRRAHIVSLDNRRIGAAEQLRCYAAILGLGFDALESPYSLRQVLEEHRLKELLLVDTPGYSAGEMDAALDLAASFDPHPQIDKYLVLSASMKSADLQRIVDRFLIFRPAGLIFTRVDETERLGPIWSEAARTGLPVPILTTGPLIPEDLEESTPERILDPIFRDLSVVAQDARGTPGRLAWEGAGVHEILAVA